MKQPYSNTVEPCRFWKVCSKTDPKTDPKKGTSTEEGEPKDVQAKELEEKQKQQKK